MVAARPIVSWKLEPNSGMPTKCARIGLSNEYTGYSGQNGHAA